MADTSRPKKVYCLWDDSAPPKLNVSGYDVVQAIRAFGSKIGAVKVLNFYVDLSGSRRLPQRLTSELQCSGVSIINTASSGRQGAASKMLIADLFNHVMDNLTVPTIVLVISADPDLGYAISMLRVRGQELVLVCPSRADANLRRLSEGNTLDGDVLDTSSYFATPITHPIPSPEWGIETGATESDAETETIAVATPQTARVPSGSPTYISNTPAGSRDSTCKSYTPTRPPTKSNSSAGDTNSVDGLKGGIRPLKLLSLWNTGFTVPLSGKQKEEGTPITDEQAGERMPQALPNDVLEGETNVTQSAATLCRDKRIPGSPNAITFIVPVNSSANGVNGIDVSAPTDSTISPTADDEGSIPISDLQPPLSPSMSSPVELVAGPSRAMSATPETVPPFFRPSAAEHVKEEPSFRDGDTANNTLASALWGCVDAIEMSTAAQNWHFKSLPDRLIYPEYYARVQHPISLAEIRGNITAGSYQDVEAFRTDMNLLLGNARAYYRRDSWMYTAAEDMERAFKSYYNEVLVDIQLSETTQPGLPTSEVPHAPTLASHLAEDAILTDDDPTDSVTVTSAPTPMETPLGTQLLEGRLAVYGPDPGMHGDTLNNFHDLFSRLPSLTPAMITSVSRVGGDFFAVELCSHDAAREFVAAVTRRSGTDGIFAYLEDIQPPDTLQEADTGGGASPIPIPSASTSLATLNLIDQLPSSPSLAKIPEIIVDASSTGIGFMSQSQWCSWKLKEGWSSSGRHIQWAELVAIELGLRAAIAMGIQSSPLRVRSDNQHAINVLKTRSTRNQHEKIILDQILALTTANAIQLTPVWISTKLNPADAISRHRYPPAPLRIGNEPLLPPHLTDFVEVSYPALTPSPDELTKGDMSLIESPPKLAQELRALVPADASVAAETRSQMLEAEASSSSTVFNDEVFAKQPLSPPTDTEYPSLEVPEPPTSPLDLMEDGSLTEDDHTSFTASPTLSESLPERDLLQGRLAVYGPDASMHGDTFANFRQLFSRLPCLTPSMIISVASVGGDFFAVELCSNTAARDFVMIVNGSQGTEGAFAYLDDNRSRPVGEVEAVNADAGASSSSASSASAPAATPFTSVPVAAPPIPVPNTALSTSASKPVTTPPAAATAQNPSPSASSSSKVPPVSVSASGPVPSTLTIPPTFLPLVQHFLSLRRQGKITAKRSTLEAPLRQLDPNIFVKFGSARFKKPIISYLASAVDRGILKKEANNNFALQPKYW